MLVLAALLKGGTHRLECFHLYHHAYGTSTARQVLYANWFTHSIAKEAHTLTRGD